MLLCFSIDDSDDSDGTLIAWIIGSMVIGMLLIAAFIIICILLIRRRWNSNNQQRAIELQIRGDLFRDNQANQDGGRRQQGGGGGGSRGGNRGQSDVRLVIPNSR